MVSKILIQNISNIYSDLMRHKKNIKPYKQYLGDHNPDTDKYMPLFIMNESPTDSFISSKSKVFYNILKARKKEIPISKRHWRTILGLDDLNFMTIY